MSRITDAARQQLWADRAEYGRDTAPRRKWCIDVWANSGALTSAQAEAAHTLWRMIEVGHDPSFGKSVDRVDRSRGDIHAYMLNSGHYRRKVEGIHHWMRLRLAHQASRWKVYERVFDHAQPQVTAAELQKHMHAGKDAARVLRHLCAALDLLAIKIDADQREIDACACGTNQP
jgi:hypothetical protein